MIEEEGEYVDESYILTREETIKDYLYNYNSRTKETCLILDKLILNNDILISYTLKDAYLLNENNEFIEKIDFKGAISASEHRYISIIKSFRDEFNIVRFQYKSGLILDIDNKEVELFKSLKNIIKFNL